MIIGINGKIGAGKDTVGEIIQKLCLTNTNQSSEIKKFAGKLKQIASILTGIPVENFEDQEFKKLDMSPEWGMTYREFLQKLGTEAMRNGLHTNVWVNALFADYNLTPDKSINESFKEQLLTGKSKIHYKLPNWIITDMRFPNELKAVKDRGGITIRVNKPKEREMFFMNAHITIDTRKIEHPSETALDDAKFDYEIINDGSMEELVKKVKEILIKEKLI